jgi:hypothetical protein
VIKVLNINSIMEVSMAQMQNVHDVHGQAGFTGYADFHWYLMFTVLPTGTPNYFQVKATLLLSGSTDYSLDSLPVYATYGSIVLTFPPLRQEHDNPVESYTGKPTSIVNNVDHLSNSINITLKAPVIAGARPEILLNGCTINQEWVIGARNILLVEPPTVQAETGEVVSEGSELS